MGLIEMASGKSVWRGYDYFKKDMVLECEPVDKQAFRGKVKGSEDKVYDVTIDTAHPKRSACNCPHAEGTRRVCKHKVALYFTAFPEEAERLLREAEEYEAMEEERRAAEIKEIERYVYSLKKEELREELFWRMIEEMERGEWY